MKLEIPTPEAMELFGSHCSSNTKPGMQFFLCGDLGAGKTTFVRGFLRGLGYAGKVKSPTYTLVEPYEFPTFPVYHFDFYRLGSALELEAIGARDYFDGSAVCLVEWPEKVGKYLGEPDINVEIGVIANGREVDIQGYSGPGMKVLNSL